jgi:hypothetical protein
MRLESLLAVALVALGGCALAPQHFVYLEQAESAYREATSDPVIALHAAPELRTAREVLERAIEARDTLQDAAEVDHLAYVAMQRIEIARAAARYREALR